MNRFLRSLALLVCVLDATWCAAQPGRLYASDRLSSGLLTCICQDRYGFVWIGTEYGLNRFDGYHFDSYFYSRIDSATITDNEISTLFVDRDGQLWVGCSKGLARYDYEHDNFRRFYFPDDRQPRISSMLQEADGRILIGTAGYGLYSYTAASGYLHYEERFNQRQLDAFYSRMHLDREGNLWRSSHMPTLTRFIVKNRQPAALRDYQSTCGIPRRYIEYGEHQLLIVCMHGILSYNYQTGEISDAGFDLSLLAPGVSIEDATMTRQGHLYLATQGNGLMKIAHGSRQLTRVEPTGGSIDMATANAIDAMEDKDGDLWVTCYSKGVVVLSRQQAAFSTWSLSSQQYVTGGGVSSIAIGENGDTWCSVQNSGIYRLDAHGRVVAHPQTPAGIRLIYRDRSGQYWLTTDNVLYRYQPETGKTIQELTLSGRGLNSITDDGNGHLYISCYGMGLYCYDPATHRGELLSMQQTDSKSGYLCNDWVKALHFDSRGLLWICTANGLSLMQPSGHVFNSRGWNVLLEGHQCLATCETIEGDMLIGTENGLYRYDWKKNKVAEEPGTDILHDKMICAMVRDRQGDIWISTTTGIWQYRTVTGSRQLIGHIAGNGLATKEYMLGVMAHQSDDRISFGTADGLVTFLPRTVDAHTRQLGVPRLTRFTVGGQSLNPMQDRFTLDYTDNSFTLEFSLFDFRNAENISFLYRLNGAAHWMQTNEGSNQLTFNQLQPGDYTLEVRAMAGGIESTHTQTLHITILEPWYKSTWAYLFYMLVIASFGGLVAFSWNRYMAEKRLHLTISNLKDNMRWLRGKFFGSLEEQGDIQQVQVKGNNDVLMERIVKCVNENLSNPDFSIEMLTREVGISRAQLHRKMKEMTGISASEFVRNLRLEQAARLILEKKINITQVAYSLGFNNQAHFSTIFKKHFGMPPTEYAASSGHETKRNKGET